MLSFDQFTDALHEAGWRNSCDAQHTEVVKVYDEMVSESRKADEITTLRAENAAQLAELNAIASAIGTNEGHSSVYHIQSLRAENAALAEQNAKMREKLASIRRYGLDTLSGRTDGPDDREWQRAGVNEMTKRANITDIPDLSTPAINRIKSEAYRECAEICRRKVQRVSNGNGISYQSFDPASVMAEYCEETIRAAADELEGMK